jgi:hypothetical protein
MQIGVVTEGFTDHVVISSILAGWIAVTDLEITRHFPLNDATDAGIATGGWGNLIDYLKSQAFRDTFAVSEIVVVHIDTDRCEDYGVSMRIEDRERTVEELIEAVALEMQSWITPDFFALVADRILFAIAVHQIECWLLPIYFTDKKRSKTTNCIDTLNQVLPQREGFSIHAKEYRYYEKMSKHFLKRKQLLQYAVHNPSLHTFVQKLETCQL